MTEHRAWLDNDVQESEERESECVEEPFLCASLAKREARRLEMVNPALETDNILWD